MCFDKEDLVVGVGVAAMYFSRSSISAQARQAGALKLIIYRLGIVK